MIPMIKRILKDKFVQLLAYSIGSAFLIWIYFPLYPTVRDQAAALSNMLKSMPESFLKAFGANNMSMDTIESLLALKHFNFVWPLLIILFLISIAGNLIAGEIENRTIELTLALPLSRLKIFFAKYLAGIVNMIVFLIVSIFTVFPLGALYGFKLQSINYFSFFLLAFAFAWAIYSLSFMASAIFSEKGKVYSTTAGLLILMYVLNILANIKDSLHSLQYFSFFYYFNSNDTLMSNHLSASSFFVFIPLAIIATIAGAYIFSKRNIAVES